ncbi:MAG: cell division protein ZapD [Gammaproteobacteria bacterium]
MSSEQQSGIQTSLFPDSNDAVVYEQPLNERMRNCLRLEHLFQAVEAGIRGGSAWDARNAVARMLEICDFLVRTDVKGELIKELERNAGVLDGLRHKPGVSERALDATLDDISRVLARLKPSDYQPGTKLRGDELANQVRQRLSIPGGTCSFDVPALHFWLHGDPTIRSAHLADWMADLRVIEQATATILKLVRESTVPRHETAPKGFFQQQVESGGQVQIVRVVMPPSATVFPEISGGKHRFTVRFYAQPETGARPVQIEQDVDFELQCCGI